VIVYSWEYLETKGYTKYTYKVKFITKGPQPKLEALCNSP
jgi:hypothetical protein